MVYHKDSECKGLTCSVQVAYVYNWYYQHCGADYSLSVGTKLSTGMGLRLSDSYHMCLCFLQIFTSCLLWELIFYNYCIYLRQFRGFLKVHTTMLANVQFWLLLKWSHFVSRQMIGILAISGVELHVFELLSVYFKSTQTCFVSLSYLVWHMSTDFPFP